MSGLVLIVALAACGPEGFSDPGPGPGPDARVAADAGDADAADAGPRIPVGRFDELYGSETAICAREQGGEPQCWSADGWAVEGAETADASVAPPELGPGPFADVAASPGGACVVRADGMIRCAGGGAWADPPDDRYTRIATSSAWRCGVTRSGRLRCWAPAGPVLLTSARDIFLDVAVSRDQICGLLETRMLQCWGGIADPIEPPRAHGAGVELRAVRVEADTKVQDLRGLVVRFEYRMPGADFDERGWLAGRLELAHAQPGRKNAWVKAALANPWFRDSRGRARAKARLQSDSNDEWQETSLFFPFCGLDLPAGAHEVRIDLKARRVPEFGSPIDSTPLIVEPLAPVTLEKPGSTKVLVGVRSATVPVGVYEGMTMDERQKRPDLAWTIELRGDRTIKLFASPTVSNRFSASWTVDAPPLVASEGDLITIRVADRDVALHDETMLFQLTPQQLLEASGPLEARPGFRIEVVAAEVRRPTVARTP